MSVIQTGYDIDSRSAFLIALTGILLPVIVTQPPWHTVTNPITDHYRHTYAAWAFLHVGHEIWTEPIRNWSQFGIPSVPHKPHSHLYPLGSVLLFLIPGIITYGGGVDPFLMNQFLVAGFVVGATGAAVYAWNASQMGADLSAIATGLTFLVAIYWAYNGFFDTIVLAVSLAGIWKYVEEEYRLATILLVSGCSLHFRVWYLGPLALVALYRWHQSAGITVGNILVTMYGAISAATGILVYQNISTVEGQAEFSGNQFALLTGAEARFLYIGLVLLLAFVAIQTESDYGVLAALGLGGVSLLLLPQWETWYAVLYLPVIFLPESREMQLGTVGMYFVTMNSVDAIPNIFGLVMNLGRLALEMV